MLEPWLERALARPLPGSLDGDEDARVEYVSRLALLRRGEEECVPAPPAGAGPERKRKRDEWADTLRHFRDREREEHMLSLERAHNSRLHTLRLEFATRPEHYTTREGRVCKTARVFADLVAAERARYEMERAQLMRALERHWQSQDSNGRSGARSWVRFK